MRSVASPVETLVRGKKFADDVPRLQQIFEERDVRALCSAGRCRWTERPARAARRPLPFARNLRTLAGIDLPTLLWDERLTSSMVEKFLIGDMDMTRGKRRKIVDQMAAVVILQSALDAL